MRDGNCKFSYGRIGDKNLLKSKTDNKLKAADDVISSFEVLANQTIKSLQVEKHCFSDELSSVYTRIEAKKLILDSYLDNRVFSGNESDLDKLLVVAKSKKRNDAKIHSRL